MNGKPVYQFKEAAHLPKGLDAQAVGERIASLKETEGSGFTTQAIVKDARSSRSPLHPAFTWDDAEAAERYRLQEAGELVRMIVTIVPSDYGDREVRAFVPVIVHDVDEQRYVSLYEAMSDEDYRQQIIERALNEMLALRRKYQDLEEFAKVFKALDAVARRIQAA